MTAQPPSPEDDPVLPDLLRIDTVGLPLATRVLHIGGAVLCFALGVVGWLIPIVPGVPFYILGLVLLAKAVPSVGERVNAWERGLAPRWRLMLRPGWRRARKQEQALAQEQELAQERAQEQALAQDRGRDVPPGPGGGGEPRAGPGSDVQAQ